MSSNQKPGFFQKLFGRSKSASSPSTGQGQSPSTSNTKDKRHASSSDDSNRHKQQGAPSGAKQRTEASAPAGGGNVRSPTRLSPPVAVDGAGVPPSPRNTAPASGHGFAVSDQPSSKRTSNRGRLNRKSSRRKKRGRAAKVGLKSMDTSGPLVFPATPEMILAYHQARPFLDKNEEWLMVELNEYECLVDGLEIVRTIAKHSKFFEVEPDELWEEFFEYVDEIPSYDEVINFDVWQEFRDEKYPC